MRESSTQLPPQQRSAELLDSIYGVLRVANMRLAVPLGALREVQPCPAQLEGLPTAARGVVGAANVRGTTIPVISLGVLLDLPAAQAAGDASIMVVLMLDGRVFGLLVHEVCGVTTAAAKMLQHVSCSALGEALLLTHTFERAEDASLVSVLDVQALARMSGVPMVRDSRSSATLSATAAVSGATDHARARRPLLLIRCGSLRLCVDAMRVQATQMASTLHASVLQGRLCRGMVDCGELAVPTVDLSDYLGLGPLKAEHACQTLLLRVGSGLVAMQLTEVIDIVMAADTEIRPIPALAGMQLSRIRGVLLAGDGSQYLCIDAQALCADPDIVALSTMNMRRSDSAAAAAGSSAASAGGRLGEPGAVGVPATARGTQAGAAAARTGSRRMLLTYSVGVEAATDLLQVKAVIAFPRDVVMLREECTDSAAPLGLFSHEGEAVPLICLPTLLGRAERPSIESARVLVIDAGDCRVGFVVMALHAIEPAAMEYDFSGPLVSRRGAAHAASQASGQPQRPIVEIGAGTERRVIPLHDLRAVARQIGLAAGPAQRAPSVEPAVA